MWKKGESGSPDKKITAETANAMREKGLEKRLENKTIREMLEGLDEDVVKMFGSSFKDVAKIAVDPDAPMGARLEAGEIVNKDHKRALARLDRIRDRVQGKPKIQADVNGEIKEQVNLVISSDAIADAMSKIEGYGDDQDE